MEAKLLTLDSKRSPAPLTDAERALVKERLREQFLHSPYYARRMQDPERAEAFLNAWLSGMACHRGLLPKPEEDCPKV